VRVPPRAGIHALKNEMVRASPAPLPRHDLRSFLGESRSQLNDQPPRCWGNRPARSGEVDDCSSTRLHATRETPSRSRRSIELAHARDVRHSSMAI